MGVRVGIIPSKLFPVDSLYSNDPLPPSGATREKEEAASCAVDLASCAEDYASCASAHLPSSMCSIASYSMEEEEEYDPPVFYPEEVKPIKKSKRTLPKISMKMPDSIKRMAESVRRFNNDL